MTEKAPKIHIETPLKNYAFTEHTISKEKKKEKEKEEEEMSLFSTVKVFPE